MVHQDETPLCRPAYTCSAATAATFVDRTIKPPAKNCVDLRGRVSWRSLPVFDRRWGQASADGGTGVLPVPPYVGGLSAFSMRAPECDANYPDKFRTRADARPNRLTGR